MSSLRILALLLLSVALANAAEPYDECLGFEAHFMTFFILFAAMMVVPFWLVTTYSLSDGASPLNGVILGSIWLVFGAIMACYSLFDIQSQLGDAGNLVTPACWLIPSFLLVVFRRRFLSQPLSQKWLAGLQLWRAIGGIFLIEMKRGFLAPIFAYAAGIGDLIVAFTAGIILTVNRKNERIPTAQIYFLIAIGVADFLSAFFFGFFSSDTPVQLFESDALHDPLVYPSGLIPLFLVPYAIFFHTLSYLTLRLHGNDDSHDGQNQHMDPKQVLEDSDGVTPREDILET